MDYFKDIDIATLPIGKSFTMNKEMSSDIFRKSFVALGILAGVGLFGYGLSYIVAMPKVSPDGFVPKTLEATSGNAFGLGATLAIFVLVYAFAFLPVNVLFTIKKYRTNPYALVFACCLISISSLLEIINNLPVVAKGIYPGELEHISTETLIYLRQIETIRYLAYDVIGFMLIYLAVFIYAMVYFKTHRWLSYTIVGSIILFIANLPCLWFAPNGAIILMALSIFALIPIPIFLARKAVED